MEAIIRDLISQHGETLLAGVPIAFNEIAKEKQVPVLTMALHCCLNGPVGVNKESTFPLVGKRVIKEVLPCSNKAWIGLCKDVALILEKLNLTFKSQTQVVCGNYWPLAEWKKKTPQTIQV